MPHRAPALRWADIAPGRPFHATLVPVGRAPRIGEYHAHRDFHELFLVTEGRGTHWVSGRAEPLRRADLVLVRPADEHAFTTDAEMSIVNVAFPSTRWHTFTGLAGVPGWDDGSGPVTVSDVDDDVVGRFHAALEGFSRGTGAVDVVRLWAEVLPLLGRATGTQRRPAWLATACAAMSDEENLRAGLPRLRELAAVSDGHLARSIAEQRGVTPVEFVTGCRLDHAALLLTTTTDPVGTIAHRCGFGSQSYFTRLFHLRHGHPPRAYRERSRRSVVP